MTKLNLPDIKEKVCGICQGLDSALVYRVDHMPNDIHMLALKLEEMTSKTRLAAAALAGYAGFVRGKANQIFKEDDDD